LWSLSFLSFDSVINIVPSKDLEDEVDESEHKSECADDALSWTGQLALRNVLSL
jgi:hypothetical protein